MSDTSAFVIVYSALGLVLCAVILLLGGRRIFAQTILLAGPIAGVVVAAQVHLDKISPHRDVRSYVEHTYRHITVDLTPLVIAAAAVAIVAAVALAALIAAFVLYQRKKIALEAQERAERITHRRRELTAPPRKALPAPGE